MEHIFEKGATPANDSEISSLVINRVFSELRSCEGVYGFDLHEHLFEEQQYTSPIKAETDLNELGIFNCINLVAAYENLYCGGFHTPITATHICNRVYYIMGEFVLKSSHLRKHCWDEQMTMEDVLIIEEELQHYLDQLLDDLSNVAFDEYNI